MDVKEGAAGVKWPPLPIMVFEYGYDETFVLGGQSSDGLWLPSTRNS